MGFYLPFSFTYTMMWLVLPLASSLMGTSASGFNQDFVITWGDGRGKIVENGSLLSLSLDQASGSGFESTNEYMFGKISMQVKLVPGDSAGTVSSFYFQSAGPNQDEIDFEFLGNISGEPYTIHTNIFTQGQGNREQRFCLWFDPTQDFHNYTILWNPANIILWVDGTPIREYKNRNSAGIPYLSQKPMKIHGSIYNGDSWATWGGRKKINWTDAPFTVYYRDFSSVACVWPSSPCDLKPSPSGDNSWMREELDPASQQKMREVQEKYMIFNYCQRKGSDHKDLHPECTQTGLPPPPSL